MRNLLSSQQSRFFWTGLFLIIITSFIFYLVLPLFGIDHGYMSLRQFIFHSLWRVISMGLFLFIVLRIIDRRMQLKGKELDETFQRYDALSQATNDVIWDYDLVNGKIYYNERVKEVFGYDRGTIADNNSWWETHLHPEDKGRVVDNMNRQLESHTDHWEDEYRFRDAGGKWRTVYDRSFIVRNEEGKPVRLIGAMKDVSELRKVEQELHEQQLRNKNIKGQEIIRSHELERKKIRDELHEDVNQILAAIKMHMGVLSTGSSGGNVSSSIQHLDDAIRKIRKISNTLSSFTLELGGLPEAIRELITMQYTANAMRIELDDSDYIEELTKKETAHLLFRVAEYELARINSIGYTDHVSLRLRNNYAHTILSISFHHANGQINESDYTIYPEELSSQLEMYEGQREVRTLTGNHQYIEVRI